MAIIFSTSRRIRDAERVDCPKCGEKAPWACRAKSGRTTDIHVARTERAWRTPREQWWSAPETSEKDGD